MFSFLLLLFVIVRVFRLPEAELHDTMPEILDGHNIADFVDPDVLSHLAVLEADEEAQLNEQLKQYGSLEAAAAAEDAPGLPPEQEVAYEDLLDERATLRKEHSARSKNNPLSRAHRVCVMCVCVGVCCVRV